MVGRDTSSLGRRAEGLAAHFFRRKGYRILGQNLRFRFGEIDLLAEDDTTLVVCEVKAKGGRSFGHPAEMINFPKREKLRRLANAVSAHFGRPVRIDIIAITDQGGESLIEHFENAIVEL